MDNSTSQVRSLQDQMVGLLPRLRRFARSLAKDPDAADDLVQSACERALNRLEQVRAGTRFDSWLYRIIYTQWIDRLRRVRSRTAHLRILAMETRAAAQAAGSAARIQNRMDLQKALSALPEEHRAAIILVCVEGYSYAEAAGVLSLPPGTIASRVARGRAMLAGMLSDEKPALVALTAHRRREGEK
ncbi:MAG: RNA polymerase sigma factor [Desulfobacterales bacterium]|nr:MAG: RNA polymerase sigma factor [Desulfobacterales bacterium]